MPTRRRLLAVLAAGLAGCGSRRQQPEPDSLPPPPMDYEPGTPSTPTPRQSPLPADRSFRWPAPYFDAANTANPATTGPTATPTVTWEAWMPQARQSAYGLIDGRWLYVIGDERLAAIDRREGWLAWSERLPVDMESFPSLSDRGFVTTVLSADFEAGIALVGTHSDLQWRQTGGLQAIPTVVTGDRIVHVAEQEVVARSLGNGAVQWRHRAAGDEQFASMPAVTEGTVYAHSGGALYAMSAATGERRWRTAAALEAPPSTAVSVGEKRVFVGYDDEGASVAFDRETGDVDWQRAGHVPIGTHAVAGDRIVTATGTGQAVAMSRQRGAVEWTSPAAVGAPIVTDEAVFVRGDAGAEGQTGLTALSLSDGERRWHWPVEGDGWVLVGDGYCFLNRGSGVVRCLG